MSGRRVTVDAGRITHSDQLAELATRHAQSAIEEWRKVDALYAQRAKTQEDWMKLSEHKVKADGHVELAAVWSQLALREAMIGTADAPA